MIRILVLANDDDRTRSIVEHFGGREGYEALGVHTGDEALRRLEDDDDIQVMIADLDREDLADASFVGRARRRQPALSCLVFGDEKTLANGFDRDTQIRKLSRSAPLDDLTSGIDELVEERRGRGFHGHLQCLSLIDIIQLYCATAKTGRLHVRHWGRQGEVYFANGKLLHAGLDDIEGPEALYRLVAWDSGTFQVDLDVLPEVDTLSHMALNALLIEATRRHDESLAPDARPAGPSADSPGHGPTGLPASRKLELLDPESLPRRRRAPLEASLVNDLLSVDGVEGVFAVNRDGEVLQTEDVHDSEETLGTLAAYLGSSCETTQETIGADRFSTALAVERSGRKLLLVNTRNFYIGVIGSAHAQADPLLRDVLSRIRQAAAGKARRGAARPNVKAAAASTGDGHDEKTGR